MGTGLFGLSQVRLFYLSCLILGSLNSRSGNIACCCQGFLLLGYDQGVMSGIVGAENQ